VTSSTSSCETEQPTVHRGSRGHRPAVRHHVIEYEEGSGGPSKETRSLRQEIFDIHDLAADYYRQAFLAPTPHGDFIRDYWVKNRKFTPELADEFKIGFAPPEDSGLAAALLKRKFTEDALRQCGLFFMRDGAIPASARCARAFAAGS
jgi:DNA primase